MHTRGQDVPYSLLSYTSSVSNTSSCTVSRSPCASAGCPSTEPWAFHHPSWKTDPGPQTLLSPRAPRAIPKLPNSPFLGHPPCLSAGGPPPSRAAGRTPSHLVPTHLAAAAAAGSRGARLGAPPLARQPPQPQRPAGRHPGGGGGAAACLTASPATNSLRPPRRGQSRREGGASAAAGPGQPRARQAGGFDRRRRWRWVLPGPPSARCLSGIVRGAAPQAAEPGHCSRGWAGQGGERHSVSGEPNQPVSSPLPEAETRPFFPRPASVFSWSNGTRQAC